MGLIYGTKVALVNVYASNWDDETFFSSLFSALPDLTVYRLIMTGDFSCWMDPILYQSFAYVSSPIKISKSGQRFNESLMRLIPAASFNKDSRLFFPPHIHHTYTGINYFLLDNRLLSSVSDRKYDAIIVSDHSAVDLDKHFQKCVDVSPPWRLNVQ